ncbi:MAG: preprotein translocase subunit SecG [Arcobacteraceae bacterium]|jgi:preprotein translocase subunit SecG|nr:preprotein translocase subunit SecG [Arcobacteraceae bacterium]
MASTLLIIQLVLTILIIIAVLLQKSSSMGLGAYSGGNDTMFGAKGPANFLVKITFTLGALFVINTIALGYTYNSERQKSVVDTLNTNSLIPQAPVHPAVAPAPTAPTVPVSTTDIPAVPSAPIAPATK